MRGWAEGRASAFRYHLLWFSFALALRIRAYVLNSAVGSAQARAAASQNYSPAADTRS